jgi:hypothetical protein
VDIHGVVRRVEPGNKLDAVWAGGGPWTGAEGWTEGSRGGGCAWACGWQRVGRGGLAKCYQSGPGSLGVWVSSLPQLGEWAQHGHISSDMLTVTGQVRGAVFSRLSPVRQRGTDRAVPSTALPPSLKRTASTGTVGASLPCALPVYGYRVLSAW